MNRKTFLKTGLFGWMAALFIPGIVVNSAQTDANLNINYKNLNKMEFILENDCLFYRKVNFINVLNSKCSNQKKYNNITITKQDLKLKKRLNLPNRKDLIIKIDSEGNKMSLSNRILLQDILRS